ncbi:MAG: DUF2197 domain-containing protein, partial [Exiguobacterium undae]
KPVRVYICDECHERVTQRTLARQETGQFHLYPTWATTKKRW